MKEKPRGRPVEKDRQEGVTIGPGDTGNVSYTPVAGGGNSYAINPWPGTVERPPRGRPTKKDWQGVLRWLVVKVAKGDLPQGRGAKAEVAGWIHQWFIDRNQEASDSLVKDQVHLIYEEAEKADN